MESVESDTACSLWEQKTKNVDVDQNKHMGLLLVGSTVSNLILQELIETDINPLKKLTIDIKG